MNPTAALDLQQVPVLLRGEPALIRAWMERKEMGRLLVYIAVIVLGTGLFGAALGSWRDPLQAIYTAIKLPLIILLTTLGNGLLNAMLAPLLGVNISLRQSLLAVLISFTIAAGLIVSALICLPSLYIFSCLSGSQARIIEVVGLIAGLLSLMTVLLVGFAPVAWVFSQSTNSLPAMGALHFFFWVIATWFGLRFLNAGFAHLSAKPGGTRIWAMIFLLVMLQMTTALRPLIGKSDSFWSPEKKFFLNHWTETMSK